MRTKEKPFQTSEEERYYDELMQLALLVGHALQLSGAETYRVEDSCQHLLQAYSVEAIEVFAVANYLSLSFRIPGGKEMIAQKRLYRRADNLRKIDLLNAAIRDICLRKPEPQSAKDQISKIILEAPRSFPVQVLMTGFVGFNFTLLVGGSLAAAAFAFLVDVLLRLMIEPLQRQQSNRIFVNILGGFLVTILAWPCRFIGLASELKLIISGSYMYLFPGISLMNSIRDIIASDYLAGITKLVETILVAVSIAIGSGLALSVLNGLLTRGILP